MKIPMFNINKKTVSEVEFRESEKDIQSFNLHSNKAKPYDIDNIIKKTREKEK